MRLDLAKWSDRFVRVTMRFTSDLECEGHHGWGLLGAYNAFLPLYADDLPMWLEEFGEDPTIPSGMTPTEVESVVDADTVDTPGEAWAALAHYRLTGERFCEWRLANDRGKNDA